ncbi:MAG: NYN domain-containing protein [Polaribacter sp.]
MRTIFYVDGFNFYYGLKKITRSDPRWREAYWIDFVKLFSQFLSLDDELIKIKYFTASPLNSGKNSRQSALFKANDLINNKKFEIVRGKYIEKDIICRNCNTHFSKPEEKRTDVNIATHLIGDCALDNVDKVILVTADSDLVPPLEFIKKNYPDKRIKIYFPPTNFSYDLTRINSGKKVILLSDNLRKFQVAKMPATVYKSDGSDSAIIPRKWIVE